MPSSLPKMTYLQTSDPFLANQKACPHVHSSPSRTIPSQPKGNALTSLHQTSDTFLANQKGRPNAPMCLPHNQRCHQTQKGRRERRGAKGNTKSPLPPDQSVSSSLFLFRHQTKKCPQPHQQQQKQQQQHHNHHRTTTTSLTARCPCRPAAHHHHQHHNGRHRAVSLRALLGAMMYVFPCLDYLLSATSNKELTAWHCAWSSPPPPPIMGTMMSARPVSFPPFSCCLFLLSFFTHLRLPFPLPFTFCFSFVHVPTPPMFAFPVLIPPSK